MRYFKNKCVILYQISELMDYLSLIKQPIEAELADFVDLFNKSLMHSDGLLSQVLDHIRQRAGKRMRPIPPLLCMMMW